MIGTFRHKGLEEIYLTGTTRRIGPDHLRKCIRILQLLEVASQPGELDIAGFHFHSRQAKAMVRASDWELSRNLRLVRRYSRGYRF
jgi:plasmid maintenance system killer protein